MPAVNGSVVDAIQSGSFQRDEIPKIGGSEGGFIGLLVALIVIIIISASVVFFLLRTQGGGGRGHGHVSHFVHAGQDGSFPVQRPKWKGFANLFGRKKNRNSGVKGGGWMQQVDEDHDFDSESESGIPLADSPTKSKKMKNNLMGPRGELPPIQSLPPLTMHGGQGDISMSSVSLQAPGRAFSKTPESIDESFTPPLTTAFHSRSPSPSPSPNLPHQISPEPLPPTLSLPASRAEPIPVTPRTQLPPLKARSDARTPIERKGTIDSVMTTHSAMSNSSQYTSGSKFQEHIEF